MSGRDAQAADPAEYPWSGSRKPRRGDRFRVRLERLDERGSAVGEVDGFRVSVRRGLLGALLEVEVLRRRGDRVEARAVEVVEPGPHAVEPRCAHFGTCGGCSFQHVDYAAQLAALGERVRRTLAPLVPGAEELVEDVLPAPDPWRYRNKMDFTFGTRRWVEEGEPEGVAADFALGLHVPLRHDKVLDVGECPIQFPGGDAVLASARRLAREHGLPAWDVREHVGVLRHLVLRRSWASGEVLVFLVTSSAEPEGVRRFAAALVAAHPEIATLVHGVHDRAASVAEADRLEVLHGSGALVEELLGASFEVSARSFFQTNSRAAGVLGEVVREELAGGADDVLYDVCCGAGVWALALAPEVREVWGFERDEHAVRDAERNAERNAVARARFVAGDVARTLVPEALAELGAPAPTRAIVDPPRAGLPPAATGALLGLAPERWVHVSCHLPSAVRDLPPVLEAGYRLVRVRPVDLFPHTPHVECVLTLERRS